MFRVNTPLEWGTQERLEHVGEDIPAAYVGLERPSGALEVMAGIQDGSGMCRILRKALVGSARHRDASPAQ